MRYILHTLVVVILILTSCTSWRNRLVKSGGPEDAISNAVKDFVNTTSLAKRDSTFSVSIREIDENVIVISLTGTVNIFYAVKAGKSSVLPTNYIEYENKLFYWKGEEYSDDNNITDVLSKYNLLDSVPSIAFIEFVNDDDKAGMDYYFCKDNLRKFKKVKTKEAVGHYNPPVMSCPK